ncbi:MAG: hypothetical protein JJU33_08880 [Phycisphaerales bacterium]|nr:hypothetical protein [Phycisphaerales bacterium]
MATSGLSSGDGEAYLLANVGFDEEPEKPRKPKKPKRPAGHRFRAELDIAELDDRGRPGATCTAHAVELSRSNLVFRSRRMTYIDRKILVAIHLIDDEPTVLFGRVFSCEYDGEGLCRIDLDLEQLPTTGDVRRWKAMISRK